MWTIGFGNLKLFLKLLKVRCRAHDYTDVVLVHEHRGKPDGLIVSRHDIKDKKAMGTVPQAYPHLIINNFTTKGSQPT
ncbi:putative anticodon-binding, Brix domain-containing protein [Rosa chinensis]|uniref:Putative anticodon-binding, Brix domain-containing protein n=1 Tax=Rosa chinensis TaxID=74649 RepID=A0A2P6S8S3_ROSCH|nr:putative anticodon-binding, Brix domain-containing protein [Rosa chinensis]